MPVFDWLRRRREQRVLQRRPIPDALWELVILRHPFLQRRSAEDLGELRRLTTLFLDAQRFQTLGPLTLTDEMAVTIAAQACLPVLRLGLHWYDRLTGIVVRPNELSLAGEVMDEDGVVHQHDDVLAGEVNYAGRVLLSWNDVQQASELAAMEPDAPVYNVVIHEFVHLMDMRTGWATGLPPIEDRDLRRRFAQVLEASFEAFCDRVSAGEEDVMDEYGTEGLDEFFPIASEAFFVRPHALREVDAGLYQVLAEFYRQDPAANRE